jgi:hypothetical protein
VDPLPILALTFSSSPLLPDLVPIFSFSGVTSWLGVSALAFLLRSCPIYRLRVLFLSKSIHLSPLYRLDSPESGNTCHIIIYAYVWSALAAGDTALFHLLPFLVFWRRVMHSDGGNPGVFVSSENLYSYSIVCYFFHTNNRPNSQFLKHTLALSLFSNFVLGLRWSTDGGRLFTFYSFWIAGIHVSSSWSCVRGDWL